MGGIPHVAESPKFLPLMSLCRAEEQILDLLGFLGEVGSKPDLDDILMTHPLTHGFVIVSMFQT